MIDVELVLIERLRTALAVAYPGLRVVNRKPAAHDGTRDLLVTVRRFAGVADRQTRLDLPSVQFQCYAPDDGAAVDLATAVRDALPALAGEDVSGAVLYPLTETAAFPVDDPDHNTPTWVIRAQAMTRRR